MADKLLIALCLCLVAFQLAHAANENSGSLNGNDSSPPASRIVSLAPSNTELVYSIGAQAKLVGVSAYCDYPPEAKAVAKAGSFVSANMERLARLKPDLILLVSGQEALAGMLRHQDFRVVVLKNNKLSQIADNLRALGRLTGRDKQAEELATSCQRSLNQLSSILRRAQSRPQVFYCVWPDPLLTVGEQSFLTDCITAAGGINVAGALKAAYPRYSVERLLVAKPDILIMPFDTAGRSFLSRQPWISVRAVKEGRVYFRPEPARDTLARPTLRVFDGLYWLTSTIHPELKEDLKGWLSQTRTLPDLKLMR